MKEEIRSKIKLVCCARKKGYPGWPHIDFDHEGLMKKYQAVLEEELPCCDFTTVFYTNPAEAIEGWKDNDQYDGVVLFNATHGVGVAQSFLDLGQPGVIIDELYAGSGDLVRLNTRINKQHLPVAVVASSNFDDAVEAINLLHVKKQLANSKILLFKNFNPISEETEAYLKEALGTGSTWKRFLAGRAGLQDKLDALKNTFGVEVVVKTKEDLENYLAGVDDEEAKAVAKDWADNAEAIYEPSAEDIFQSARMYLALQHAVDEEHADAVSVDCIMMFYTTEMSAYPCMSHSKMCDMGIPAVCESDLDSTLTEMMVQFMTGLESFVSDPVIDTASNQIIYAHCSAGTKFLGDGSPRDKYYLRNHAEDHQSTSIQTIMPIGYDVTTVKFDILSNSMAIHTGRAVANVTDEKGCRTKLAAEVDDVQRLMDNWDTDVFSWHKVTFYGDWRTNFLNLAKLYGSKIVQEDRDTPRFD